MIDRVKRFFDALGGSPASADDHADDVRIATAVLLIEMMRADASVAEAEQQRVTMILREKFALDDAELAQLLAHGTAAADTAYDLHRFTSQINKQFDNADKAQVIEYLWQVAYVDGELSAHENHLMRKVADLLYVPLADAAAAKARARQAVGL